MSNMSELDNTTFSNMAITFYNGRRNEMLINGNLNDTKVNSYGEIPKACKTPRKNISGEARPKERRKTVREVI